MKILKVTGIVLLILAILLIILNILAPKELNVERTVHIEAPAPVVHEYVVHFENFESWSPWLAKDPDVESHIEGVDGEEGASFHWKGNDDVGSGKQRITSVEPNEIRYEITFKEPFESQAESYIRIIEEGGGSRITWGFTSSLSFPGNIFFMFMNMEDAISEDFDEGLSNIKSVVEEEYRTDMMIHETRFEERTFIQKRIQIPFANIQSAFMRVLPELREDAESLGLELSPSSWGIYYEAFQEDNIWLVDVGIAYEVLNDARPAMNGYVYETIEGDAVKVKHRGHYNGLDEVHADLHNFALNQRLVPEGPTVEEYEISAMDTNDPGEWVTNVWLLVDKGERE